MSSIFPAASTLGINVLNDELSSVDKRNSNNFLDPFHQHHNTVGSSDSHHHFDVCYGKYGMKDLGQNFYPRFIGTANCRNVMPANLQDLVECTPIQYHVQVLTRRQETHNEHDASRSNLPESLRDWRFVHVPVNVGCHCSIVNTLRK